MKRQLLMFAIALLCCLTALHGDVVRPEENSAGPNPRNKVPYTYKQRSTPVGASVGVQRDRSAEAKRQKYLDAVDGYLARLQDDSDNKHTLYKLAVNYALLNEPELAAHYVTQSYLNGYRNLKRFEKSKKFRLVRDAPVFINTLESLKAMQTGISSQQQQR